MAKKDTPIVKLEWDFNTGFLLNFKEIKTNKARAEVLIRTNSKQKNPLFVCPTRLEEFKAQIEKTEDIK